ncbi:MAG: peptide chain release factor N(5)-glutamine methyltransferase [Syntrophothermus sp.]
MMTILEGIKLSTEFFEKKGIESPRVNAEMLLAHVLKCKRLELYLSFDKPMKQHEIDEYRDCLRRRAGFEPLQYIIGEVEFYGYPFKVEAPVLIPRPETEILIETIISCFTKEDAFSCLDIGTGTGNIAITLAKHFPDAVITSIDVNEKALDLAGKNAELNGTGNVNFLKGSILEEQTGIAGVFDIIVSNPPYISKEEFEGLQPEITKFESPLALTDGGDGLNFYRVISEKSSSLLKAGGYLFFEMGQGQFEEITAIMEAKNFGEIKIVKDYLNIERVIYGVKK